MSGTYVISTGASTVSGTYVISTGANGVSEVEKSRNGFLATRYEILRLRRYVPPLRMT